MKCCGFCGAGFHESGVERANEHVLRLSLLTRLGMEKAPLNLKTLDSELKVVKKRSLAAQALQAGDVCKKCNNGWMDELDHRVEAMIEEATRPGASLTPTSQQSHDLSRWILKTTCAADLTSGRDRRQLPEKIVRSVKEEGYFPPAFTAFTFTDQSGHNLPFIATSTAWICHAEDEVSLTKTHPYKSVVGYGKAGFGCAFLLEPVNLYPMWIGTHGLHKPLPNQKASMVLLDTPPPVAMHDGFAGNIPNYALHCLNVVFSDVPWLP